MSASATNLTEVNDEKQSGRASREAAIHDLKSNFSIWVKFAFRARAIIESLDALHPDKKDSDNINIILNAADALLKKSCNNNKTPGYDPEKALSRVEALKELLVFAGVICDFSKIEEDQVVKLYQLQRRLVGFVAQFTAGVNPLLSMSGDESLMNTRKQLSYELISYVASAINYILLREFFFPSLLSMQKSLDALISGAADSKEFGEDFFKQARNHLENYLREFGESGRDFTSRPIWQQMSNESYYAYSYAFCEGLQRIRQNMLCQVTFNNIPGSREAFRKLNQAVGLALDDFNNHSIDFRECKPREGKADQFCVESYALYKKMLPFNLDLFLRMKEIEFQAMFSVEDVDKLKELFVADTAFESADWAFIVDYQEKLALVIAVVENDSHRSLVVNLDALIPLSPISVSPDLSRASTPPQQEPVALLLDGEAENDGSLLSRHVHQLSAPGRRLHESVKELSRAQGQEEQKECLNKVKTSLETVQRVMLFGVHQQRDESTLKLIQQDLKRIEERSIKLG